MLVMLYAIAATCEVIVAAGLIGLLIGAHKIVKEYEKEYGIKR